jgi:arsenite methyltransferase
MSTSTDPLEQSKKIHVEDAVRERYSSASKEAEPELCCAVEYDTKYLKILPDEIIERDYGCGDPSKYVEAGETVLDLGSGGGKICYIASQKVGPRGRVLGVDMNDDMLALARKYQGEMSEKIGWDNVEFYKGRIQDLALDFDKMESHLANAPISDANTWLEAEKAAEHLRLHEPMIADNSIDVVVSNCVLNLVRSADRKQLFEELHRVLKRGGRAVISDIVCDEHVPEHLQNDAKLWSGCISGAFQEHEFLHAFEEAGFYGVEILARQEEPWTTVEGIEFRSMTVQAYKGKDGPCVDYKQAVVYKGPWKSVIDDDGHVLKRGVRTAVCQKTFDIYTGKPYADQIVAIEPYEVVADEDAKDFDCHRNQIREPRETKGKSYSTTQLPISDCCGPTDCC